jgi:hypothetical protein
MGEYPFHVDAIMTRPTITVDGKIIEKDGMFVTENLAELQRRIFNRSWSINSAEEIG